MTPASVSAIRLAVDVSDIKPENAGIYTYWSQLLPHVVQEAPDVELLLYDPSGRVVPEELRSVVGASVDSARFIRSRSQWTLSCGPEGRLTWLRNRGFMRAIDRLTLDGLWQFMADHDSTGRFLLPGGWDSLEVVHWSLLRSLPARQAASVYTLHDTIPLIMPGTLAPSINTAYSRQMRRLRNSVTRVIADSESTRRDAVRLGLFDEERIDVVPLAASESLTPPRDASEQERVLRRYGLRQGDYLLYLGTVEPRKNLPRLAQAFKAVIDRYPERSTRLVIAGKLGWKTEPIQKALEDVGLGERLVLTGRVPQEDVPALLNGARAVALVSLYEGFGLPPLEAMSCGSAVLASNTSSLPEVVGDAGLLVDPENIASIARAIESLLTNDELVADLRDRGLRRSRLFSWDRTARLTLETYRRAVRDRDSSDKKVGVGGKQ